MLMADRIANIDAKTSTLEDRLNRLENMLWTNLTATIFALLGIIMELLRR